MLDTPITRAASVKRAFASPGSGVNDSPIVAAVPNRRIRVLAAFIRVGALATSVTFQSGSNAISPVIPNGPNDGLVLPLNEAGWFETAAGEALTVDTSAGGSATSVLVVYQEI